MGRSERFEIQCDSCATDLSNLVSIKCAECVEEEYDLCVPCFAKGASSKNHKPWHDYIIIEQQAYPIFSNEWGADEELLLNDGMDQFGIGSWQDIADHIGRRSKEEVEQHYKTVYIESNQYPMPQVVDHPLLDDMGEFMDQRKKRLEKFNAHQQLMRSEQTQRGALASIPACHEIQGYMPGRLEFDPESENDAEMVIKNMVFDPEDSELDMEQKLCALSIYNSRLERRTERKRTIFNHNLLEYRKLMAADKKRSKEERDMYNKLKPFIRLLPQEEFDHFTEDIMAEQQYRHRIAELQEYRQNGIKTLEQAQKYEKEKQARHNAIFRVSQAPIPPKFSYFEAEGNGSGSGGGNSSSAGPNTENEPVTIKVRKMNGVASLDVSHSPDVELLSPQERILCTQLRIVPKAYLVVKEAVFQSMINNGGNWKRKSMRELLSNVDEQRVGRLYDFFVSQNWAG